MNHNFEKKTLQQLKALLAIESADIPHASLIYWGLLLTAAILFLAGYAYVQPCSTSVIVGIGLITLSGLCIGWGAYFSLARKQWPFIHQHLDHSSIDERLNQLTPNPTVKRDAP